METANNMIIRILAIMVMLKLMSVNTEEVCRTPKNEEGRCRILDKCKTLRNIIQQEYITPTMGQLIYDSRICSDVKMYCCPPQPRPLRQGCRAAGSEQVDGACVPLVICPWLWERRDDALSLEAAFCFNATRDKVAPGRYCCPLHKPIKEKHKAIETKNYRCGVQARGKPHPWIATLEYVISRDEVQLLCDGVLISRKLVLTPAHCVIRRYMSKIRVRLGDYDKIRTEGNYMKDEDGEHKEYCESIRRIQVETILPFVHYSEGSSENDIAIIKLAEQAPYTDNIRPICIINREVEIQDGDIATVVGVDHLFQETVTMTEDQEVDNVLRVEYDSGRPCAGGPGAPLMTRVRWRWTLVGIAVTPCDGEIQKFTNLTFYSDWISEYL